MRRRFGRGRRTTRSSGERPIDAARALAQIAEAGLVEAPGLAPTDADGLPPSFAALGVDADGRVVVGFAPHGGDAALAAVACAQRLSGAGSAPAEVVAVAPQWSGAARRRLALIGEVPYPFRALAAPALGDDGGVVEPEPVEAPPVLSVRDTAAQLAGPAQRPLFLRAAAALEGLAAKHGGAVRGTARGVELVVLARCVAALRSDGSGLVLETHQPERSSAQLSPDSLATALDRLEGQLRKRLNDRRVRASDEGLRAQLLAPLAEAAGLRTWRAWPLAGNEHEVLDLAGVDAEGRPAVGAVRGTLSLAELGGILDASLALLPAAASELADRDGPLQLVPPRLLLVAREYDAAVLHALGGLALDCEAWNVILRRGREPGLEARPLAAVAPAARAASAPAPAAAPPSATEAAAPDASETAGNEEEDAGEGAARADAPRGRGPRRGGRRGGGRFEEISLFDLEDESEGGDAEEGASRRRRRGRRRRGRRGGSGSGGRGDNGEGGAEASAEPDEPAEPEEVAALGGRRGPQRDEPPESRRAKSEDEEEALADEELDLSSTLALLEEDVPDLVDDTAEESPGYDEDEEADEEDSERDRLRAEREARRRARISKVEPEPEPEPTPKAPRRRAAIVAHADRDSVLAAILLARDLRVIEGFWVYPQAELMTFFRSVATDLREETPICVVGFTASPARDTIQAAALYRGRLSWFDHHEWPPEDLERMKQEIGAENVSVSAYAGSSVPQVLAVRTRRSRFSDKLVELATGRFTQHDYERWGRLWWHRLGELARQPGERRAQIEPLMVGRPSELARESAKAPEPPLPEEASYLSGRDFRIVHFGGYILVVVPLPPQLDLHLAARVARERYAAQLSLAYWEGAEIVVLGGDEGRGRRGLDLSSMIEHLVSKHEWIEALADEDHVARLRVRGLATDPERLEELVRDIAMGRSHLEG